MEHITVAENGTAGRLRVKASGEYFTPEVVGRHMAQSVLKHLPNRQTLRVIDPFGGDGRLIEWLMEEAARSESRLRRIPWEVHTWDISAENTLRARARIRAAAKRTEIAAKVRAYCGDSFERAKHFNEQFDIVVTNPPWEHLKPDRRDLLHLSSRESARYIAALRNVATRLSREFPHSAPGRAFSGWGVNLSRVGLEAAMRLAAPGGVTGIVLPASFLADHTSIRLREWLFEQYQCVSINHYPAEARLFSEVDQPFAVLTVKAERPRGLASIVAYDDELRVRSSTHVNVHAQWIREMGYCVPTALTTKQLKLLQMLQEQPKTAESEGRRVGELWIGREMDETNLSRHVSSHGTRRFLKGRYVDRYTLRRELDPLFVNHRLVESLPPSVRFARLVWRDVSRPNQKRRIHATVIPPGYVTGNSLGVLHDWRRSSEQLLWLLGVVSSLTFEYQIRALLSTGHI